ncbi:MAG: TRIC cation channel family protein [Hornefia sp.]|nr:TRIC cation channel family protein [Hornefia sp.]
MLDAIFVFEIIGTIAFAISGAVAACQKQMDLFGVTFLGMTSAVGGGIIRDLILGINPPATFKTPVYLIVAIATTLVVFIPWVQKIIINNPIYYGRFMLITDSIGLGIFTVNGIEIAMHVTPDANYFLFAFVGVVTGVGGGVLRDVMLGDKPYIFVKHFYASASLIGAVVCVSAHIYFGPAISVSLGMFTVIALRLIAAHFRWSLPKSGVYLDNDKGYEESETEFN